MSTSVDVAGVWSYCTNDGGLSSSKESFARATGGFLVDEKYYTRSREMMWRSVMLRQVLWMLVGNRLAFEGAEGRQSAQKGSRKGVIIIISIPWGSKEAAVIVAYECSWKVPAITDHCLATERLNSHRGAFVTYVIDELRCYRGCCAFIMDHLKGLITRVFKRLL